MIKSPETLLSTQAPLTLGALFIAQIFTVFLTGVKLIPGLRNNFGPFEILGGVFILSFLVVRIGRSRRLRAHPIIKIQVLLTILATLSLFWYQGPSLRIGIVQIFILVFQLLFVLLAFNFMLDYQISPEKLLRLVAYSALIIGPWILIAGLDPNADIQEAGPFRNRAHMANYMLTAFWLVLLFNSWPGIAKRERMLSYLALASTLYPIAVSGRRSVYLSLIFGLIGIGLSFLVAARGRRLAALLATLVVFGSIGLMYAYGPRWVPQLEFFKDRVAGISDRLEMAVGSPDSDAGENFFSLQRAGAFAAARDYPIAGIGWGAFYKSRYSPTGHEIHSTPLRFLAELGLIGFGLYAALMGILLVGSLQLIGLLRDTAYRTPAVILTVALWSLCVSFIYNRHVTERTFWLLLLFYVTFEAFARSLVHRNQRVKMRARPKVPKHPPGQVAAVWPGGGVSQRR